MKAAYTHTLEKAGGNPTLLQGPKIGSKPVATSVHKLDIQIWVMVKTLVKFHETDSNNGPGQKNCHQMGERRLERPAQT